MKKTSILTIFLFVFCFPTPTNAFSDFVSGGNGTTLRYTSDGVTPVYIQGQMRIQGTASPQTTIGLFEADPDTSGDILLDQATEFVPYTGAVVMHYFFWYGVLPEDSYTIKFTAQAGTSLGLQQIYINDTMGYVENLSLDGFWLFFSALLFLISFLIGANLFKRK